MTSATWAEIIAKKAEAFLTEIDKEVEAEMLSDNDLETKHSPDYYWTKQELLRILREYRKENRR